MLKTKQLKSLADESKNNKINESMDNDLIRLVDWNERRYEEVA